MTRRTPTTPASTDSTRPSARTSRRPWADACKSLVSLAVLVGLALALGGCASRYEVTKLGGVVVHTITHAHANMHVVVENGRAIAVDTGMKSTAEDMELDLQNVGVPPESLKAIVVSHGHHDHAGGARFFQKKYGTKIIAGRADLHMMQTGRNELICPVGFVARMRHAVAATDAGDGYALAEEGKKGKAELPSLLAGLSLAFAKDTRLATARGDDDEADRSAHRYAMVEHALRRLHGNGSPQLVMEGLVIGLRSS